MWGERGYIIPEDKSRGGRVAVFVTPRAFACLEKCVCEDLLVKQECPKCFAVIS
jgi:hypothetical protein